MYEERLTVDGQTITFRRPSRPVDAEVQGAPPLRKWNLFDPALAPSNQNIAEGTPMPLLVGDGVRVEVSKRTKEEMPFWHRNADYDEVILCVSGQIHWETELGELTLNPGELFRIPKGVAHRSKPGHTDQPNVIVELKLRSTLRPAEGVR
jgi:mannose-6-phosphate isomerase-like protein (cupin superfamily)